MSATAPEIARRLRAAIEARAMSERAFAREMEDRLGKGSGQGASRAMIQRYLTGDASPPALFLVRACELLGVNIEWLIAGTGAARAPVPADYGDRNRFDTLRGLVDQVLEGEFPGIRLHMDPVGAETIALYLYSCVPVDESIYEGAYHSQRFQEAVESVLGAFLAPVRLVASLRNTPLTAEEGGRFIAGIALGARALMVADEVFWRSTAAGLTGVASRELAEGASHAEERI